MQASWRAAALLALAGPVLPALAAVGSSASLTGLRYELVDLRPDDGIAPSIRFTGLSRTELRGLVHWCFSPDVCKFAQDNFTAPTFNAVDYADSRTGGRMSIFAATSPAGLFVGGQYENNGSIGALNSQYSANARLRGKDDGHPLFVLSAHTGVRVTGQYTLDAWSVPEALSEPANAVYAARAGVYVHSRFIDGPDFFKDIRAHDTFEHATGELSVLLSNHKDRTATVWGRIGVLANGQVPTGIPEPSTWALLLAGGLLLGGVARRRGAGTAA